MNLEISGIGRATPGASRNPRRRPRSEYKGRSRSEAAGPESTRNFPAVLETVEECGASRNSLSDHRKRSRSFLAGRFQQLAKSSFLRRVIVVSGWSRRSPNVTIPLPPRTYTTMNQQPLNHRTYRKGRVDGLLDVLGGIAFFSQMLAGVGGLILLFSALAVGHLWTVCWGPLSRTLRTAPPQDPEAPHGESDTGAVASSSRRGEGSERWRVQPVLIRECDA